MAEVIVHADFRIEIKVNPAFYEMFEKTEMENEKTDRAKKNGWEGEIRTLDQQINSLLR